MTAKSFHQIVFCFVMAGALTVRAEPRSQTDSRGNLLPPPKAGLVAVQGPDHEKLEAAVRDQLIVLEKSLATLVKDSSADDSKLGEAYGLMGQVYHAYSLTSPAEQCYLNAHRLAPKDFRWAYLLGNVYQKEGRAEEALTYYKLARKLRPDYLAVPVNAGNLYLARNRLEEARASFQEALASDTKCAAAQYGLGQTALSARNYAEAVDYLRQALALIPDANRIHYALAMAYRGLGEIEKAKAHLEKQGPVGVRVPDPLVDGLQELIKGERIHLLRGRLAFDALRFSEAADEFRKAVAANPESIPARVNLGSSLAQLGDINGAIEQFGEAIRLDPHNAASHYNLGFLFAKQNRHDRAISHLQTLLRLSPNDSQARFLLGQESLKAGLTQDALAEFSRLVEADADNEDALLERVKLLMSLKRYREAMEKIEKSYALFPQKGRTAVMLAYLLASNPQSDLRDGERALELARLVYQATGSVNHGAIVAMALAELGRCDEAAEWQTKMIAAAEQQGNTDLARKLETDLKRYEKARPCRPEGEAAMSGASSGDGSKKP